MTQYLSITALQEPFDLGKDEAGRAQCAFNVLCMKRPSDTFLAELVVVLEEAGVGQRGVTIFASSMAVIPEPDGGPGTSAPLLSIKATGGAAPLGTHNAGAGAYRRPGAQVIARARTWREAEALAHKAYNALTGVLNSAVVA